MVARARQFSIFAAAATVGCFAGCFAEEATLGLDCTSARSCGRDQVCLDGTCQRENKPPKYCPKVDNVNEMPSTVPSESQQLVLTDAVDFLGECFGREGSQAVFTWTAPEVGSSRSDAGWPCSGADVARVCSPDPLARTVTCPLGDQAPTWTGPPRDRKGRPVPSRDEPSELRREE